MQKVGCKNTMNGSLSTGKGAVLSWFHYFYFITSMYNLYKKKTDLLIEVGVKWASPKSSFHHIIWILKFEFSVTLNTPFLAENAAIWSNRCIYSKMVNCKRFIFLAPFHPQHRTFTHARTRPHETAEHPRLMLTRREDVELVSLQRLNSKSPENKQLARTNVISNRRH